MFCRLYIGKGRWVYRQTCPKWISALCPQFECSNFFFQTVHSSLLHWASDDLPTFFLKILAVILPDHVGKCRQINADLCVCVSTMGKLVTSLSCILFGQNMCLPNLFIYFFHNRSSTTITITLYSKLLSSVIIRKEKRQRHSNWESLGESEAA